MKLATIFNGTKDGALVVVSKDGQRFFQAKDIVNSLQDALEDQSAWAKLEALSDRLNSSDDLGNAVFSEKFMAPLPRSWQWLDGSAYASHAELLTQAMGLDAPDKDVILMYQGMSDAFYGPTDDVSFVSEDNWIDFEGEFAVIMDEVPQGTLAKDAGKYIRLIVQLNDWSLRGCGMEEIKTGFGFIHAKPQCSMAPFAVTPKELGTAWQDNQVHLNLDIKWNGQQFGNANGGHMAFGFDVLIAYAAQHRTLSAGTIIGSGTVSNANFREVGSSCIAERRGIEVVDQGKPITNFMKFGDRVRMEAKTMDDQIVFGAIDQKIVPA